VRILRHLFKLEASSAAEPRRGWEESVDDARLEIEATLQDSPSLRREVPRLVAEQMPQAVRLALRDLARHSEPADSIRARLDSGGFTVDEVLGDWFPDKSG
jgi:outer membrane protein TolC